jgi:hypothetical protein
MLRGQFRPIWLERLLRCLVALGQSVTIGIGRPTGQPSIHVVADRDQLATSP